MNEHVEKHYSGSGSLADAIAGRLRAAGKDTGQLTTRDLAPVDEFHIRGRKATLELAERMGLSDSSQVLDIGSGLGGPARTLVETWRCHVTGIDLTASFCEAAEAISGWLGLADRLQFVHGDATDLPFEDNRFDAAMTIHVAMNIADKAALYARARRVIRPGGIFAVYDVLQGEGGDVVFPVPWAREPSISFLATPQEMRSALAEAGFEVLEEEDSTDESLAWFQAMVARGQEAGAPAVTFQTFLGDDFPRMARNQVRNLTDKRIRTVSYICKA